MSASNEATGRPAYPGDAADTPRCVVHVRIGTQAIRALFAGERPPVPDQEWDEAAYVEQRLRAYRDALESLACVRPLLPPPGRDGRGVSSSGEARDGSDPVDEEASVAPPPGAMKLDCPRTGDRAIVDFDAGA